MEEELEEMQAQDFDEEKLAETLGCRIEELKTKKNA